MNNNQCIICGQPLNSEAFHRGGHRGPDHPGKVYIIHLDTPRELASVDDGSRGKILTHYVGWTSQKNPYARITQHKAKRSEVVYMEDGTPREEHALHHSNCPKCGDVMGSQYDS
jgi:hypothetical protein